MKSLPVRFGPGIDLRAALQGVLAQHAVQAAYVIQGIGSLSVARIRFAGMAEATALHGDLEILTLGGTLSPDGVHLHISVSDAAGRVVGGHMGPGCMVRTTAEVLVALLEDHRFTREFDARTGFPELAIGLGSDP